MSAYMRAFFQEHATASEASALDGLRPVLFQIDLVVSFDLDQSHIRPATRWRCHIVR